MLVLFGICKDPHTMQLCCIVYAEISMQLASCMGSLINLTANN